MAVLGLFFCAAFIAFIAVVVMEGQDQAGLNQTWADTYFYLTSSCKSGRCYECHASVVCHCRCHK